MATLAVPSWGAWYVAFTAKDADELVRALGLALGPLWAAVALVLALRAAALLFDRTPTQDRFAQLDVLTAAGMTLAWLSALAIAGAVTIGYASLAVLGLLGTSVFHLAVLRTLLVVRGTDPTRAASTIRRRFAPDVATEGDDVIEEVRFAGTTVPLGFRLFASGRIGPRWPATRHTLESAESGGEVLLESELGPAIRGEHDAAPLEIWLEDTFGLTRSVRALVAPAKLTVLPRLRTVDRAAPLLARGEGPRAPRAASRLPTEGHFHLREYRQGDDVRRIHWVRSLAARELVVRMPDELPPDRPHVRLVLDTYFPEAFGLTCDAPAEMLDALVAVWVGVARALSRAGVRVSLVTATDDATARRIDVGRRDAAAAQALGAVVRWQATLPVSALLTDEPTFVVSRGMVMSPPESGAIRWILVLPTIAEVPQQPPSPFRHAHPAGASDNRRSRRRRVFAELAKKRLDHRAALRAMQTFVARPPPGSLLATLRGDEGRIHLERIP
jgi:uncharacterized protein (DUF58 family)